MTRRAFLQWLFGSLAIATLLPYTGAGKAFATDMVKKLLLSNQAWKAKLTPAQYHILREEGTERAFTSPLLHEHRKGTFVCAACGLPLFLSTTKYDSGTGWPSFFKAIAGHIETKTDYKLGVPRTEYHCAKCGGHHGHVFKDGPKPTGLRYCNNGVALRFVPEGG